MQIFHLHELNKRVAVQSVLIRAVEDGYDDYFQQALNAFLIQYRDNQSACGRHIRARRQLVSHFHKQIDSNWTNSMVDYNMWADFSVESDHESYEQLNRDLKFEGGVWDPHHWDLIPTLHFHRYEGRLTEPRK